MSFGTCNASRGRLETLPLGPGAGAEGYVHPVGPRCDKVAETSRPPVPPVPRAPRAKPKASTRGYMAREGRRGNPHVEICDRSTTPPTQCSEARRPRAESPFAYARKHSLSRERGDADNQAFEMGPPRRNAEERMDYRRFPRADSCPPVEIDDAKHHARRRTLQRERQAADQGLEWAPEPATGLDQPGSQLPSHARRRLLDKENIIADKVQGVPTFGRIMGRDASAPPASCCGQAVEPGKMLEEVSRHGRKSLLAREREGSLSHEGQTFSRVMCR